MAFNPIASAHLRIARLTDRLDEVVDFYVLGLGFEEVGRFIDHNGFDGVMLGHYGAAYHLEFTHARGHEAGRPPTQDNLLVFYLTKFSQWNEAVQRMKGVF